MAKKKVEQAVKDQKAKEYELVYILNPDMSEDALETGTNNITQYIIGREGVVDAVDKWGKKKLAYPIKHYLEGNYILTRFKMSPARCKELEANLRISENVIRHLLIKVGK